MSREQLPPYLPVLVSIATTHQDGSEVRRDANIKMVTSLRKYRVWTHMIMVSPGRSRTEPGGLPIVEDGEGQNAQIAKTVQEVTRGRYVPMTASGTSALSSTILPELAQQIALRYIKQMAQHRIVLERAEGAKGPMRNFALSPVASPGREDCVLHRRQHAVAAVSVASANLLAGRFRRHLVSWPCRASWPRVSNPRPRPPPRSSSATSPQPQAWASRTSTARAPRKYFAEIMGSGGLFFDFDDDGWIDIFLVDGGSVADPKVAASARHRLFRNRRNQTFENITAQSGIRHREYGMGACAGDYDNDGAVDLYVTNYGPNALFRNAGQGRFTEVPGAGGAGRRSGAPAVRSLTWTRTAFSTSS